ncbi:MAG: nucleotidyltransferase domain-containing protein [Phormidesmis sp.]
MSLMPATLNTLPASAEQRRQAAWKVAEQCSHVLKQDFGATEVIVFGSLRGDAPWHNRSDLDLAVRGIPSDNLLKAFDRLETTIVPSWLPFDLVAVERADERVRDRILQTTPIPENTYLALQQRLKDELAAIQQTVDTLVEVIAQADTVAEIIVTPALASYIEDFYTGCERLAERVVVTLDGGLPTGENWHQQLLQQVAEPGGYERPPLWERSLLQELDEYRRFRHRVRHLYNLDLSSEKVLELAQPIPELSERLKQAVEQFGKWLEETSN